ncbi:hypothetical protein [Ferribacterium limneticum]|uniref:hypothetical protein n=1 Tax=Ferribacterium limneticum TaxID=76259 RepID=UPI001CF9A3CF|nr:hypothetical protein [Ferribacterium limneticum]UCV28421.1 hypothetical protein KI617_19635 [Ferribacterium limneticum]UCV32338.1 hypothetical protein KI608_19635 [Ferribacterium limneticum]
MTARLSVGILLCGLLAACANYDGAGKIPVDARLIDVEYSMGIPALRWKEADGGETLAYPFGAMGYHTFFVHGDANGRFHSRENVLTMKHFARITSGMTQEQVLRTIGPPVPAWTVYFKARDELVWEWRYCDDWNEPARFNVLFDGTSGQVRSTLASTERARNVFGAGDRRSWCSH